MILVTGASQGIGQACARDLLDRTDASVLITGRSAAKLEHARAALPAALQPRLDTMVCDQASRWDIDRLAERLRAADRVDAAILTVGVNPMYDHGPHRIHAIDPRVVEATIATNCTHTFLLSGVLLERFRSQRAGRLVWIGSQAAAAGFPGAALYCATKSFLSGLARSAVREYGGRGVRVHVVHPGLVRTPRTTAVADAFAAEHGLTVQEPAAVAGRIVDLLLGEEVSALEVSP